MHFFISTRVVPTVQCCLARIIWYQWRNVWTRWLNNYYHYYYYSLCWSKSFVCFGLLETNFQLMLPWWCIFSDHFCKCEYSKSPASTPWWCGIAIWRALYIQCVMELNSVSKTLIFNDFCVGSHETLWYACYWWIWDSIDYFDMVSATKITQYLCFSSCSTPYSERLKTKGAGTFFPKSLEVNFLSPSLLLVL